MTGASGRAVERGRLLLELGRPNDALIALREATTLDPESTEAWCWLSACLIDLKLLADALNAAEQAIAIDPETALGHMLHARALAESWQSVSGNPVSRAPSFASDNAEMWAQVAFTAIRTGRSDEALSASRIAVELDPASDFGWAMKALAELESGMTESAEASCLEALRLDPSEFAWHFNYGLILLSLGRFADAAASFQRTLELEPDDDADRYLATAVGLAGDPERAAAILSRAVENELRRTADVLHQNPDESNAHCRRAQAFLWAGDAPSAVVEIDCAVRLDPTNAMNRYHQAIILEHLGSLEAARRAALAAIRLNRNGSWTFELLGRLYALLARPRGGVWAISQLRTIPHRPEIMLAVRGYSSAAAARWDDAAHWLSQAVAANPAMCCASAWLGIASCETGDVARAEQEHQRVLAIFPTCACPSRTRLAEALGRRGRGACVEGSQVPGRGVTRRVVMLR